jgi:hypothetical protein
MIFLQSFVPLIRAESSHKCEISMSSLSTPGSNKIHDVITAMKRIRLYARRVDVEPLHDGHDAQQSEQNAFPKQHAIVEPRDPIYFRSKMILSIQKEESIFHKSIFKLISFPTLHSRFRFFFKL